MKKFVVDIHTSTAADGNMAVRFGDAESVEKNRRQFLSRCGLADTRLALMEVSHGDVVRDVARATFDGAEALSVDAEALVIKDVDVTLFLLTADCIPVVFFDPVVGVVALAHLGWRPTVLGLAEKTIHHLEATYHSKPHDLEIFLGPSIHAASYAFPDVTQSDGVWAPHLQKDAFGLIHVDLPGYVKHQCMRLGVQETQVHMSAIDTAVDVRYFSHAWSKKTGAVEGRFATIVTLRYANEA
jgi:copper oxidase (laccase) domain-containing protein